MWRPGGSSTVTQRQIDLTQQRSRGRCTDWRSAVTACVSRSNRLGAAGGCGGNLHGILEIADGQSRGIAQVIGGCRRYLDEVDQLEEKSTGVLFSSNRRHKIVKIRNGMPGNETLYRTLLTAIQKSSGGLGMGHPIERYVQKNVGIEQDDQRYFFARYRYRSSLRFARRNLPRHRSENFRSLGTELISRNAVSMTSDSEVPLWRAYCLALGTSFSSIVTVSLVFTFRVYSITSTRIRISAAEFNAAPD